MRSQPLARSEDRSPEQQSAECGRARRLLVTCQVLEIVGAIPRTLGVASRGVLHGLPSKKGKGNGGAKEVRDDPRKVKAVGGVHQPKPSDDGTGPPRGRDRSGTYSRDPVLEK